MPGTSGRFVNSEKLPSPRSGYRCLETPDSQLRSQIALDNLEIGMQFPDSENAQIPRLHETFILLLLYAGEVLII